MKFRTGDRVRVTRNTCWDRFVEREGVVYPDLMSSIGHSFCEPHVLVIFCSDHADQARRLESADIYQQQGIHDDAYLDNIQAFIEVDCLELVKHGPAHKRRGKRHRMRIGGIDGEAVLWR